MQQVKFVLYILKGKVEVNGDDKYIIIFQNVVVIVSICTLSTLGYVLNVYQTSTLTGLSMSIISWCLFYTFIIYLESRGERQGDEEVEGNGYTGEEPIQRLHQVNKYTTVVGVYINTMTTTWEGGVNGKDLIWFIFKCRRSLY